MTDSIRAVRIITERIMKEIETRLDTYHNHLRGETKEDWDKAQAARKEIEEWAISDISFLLTECRRLQRDASIYIDCIENRHSCNDCGNQKTCSYAPGWGDKVRHNCVFWEAEQVGTLG